MEPRDPLKATSAYLADAFCGRFPRIFKGIAPPFEVGGGWLRPIATALGLVDIPFNDAQASAIRVQHIYARHGQLRINGEPLELIERVLTLAQVEAGRTCFFNGMEGKTRRINGRYFPACEACANDARSLSQRPEGYGL